VCIKDNAREPYIEVHFLWSHYAGGNGVLGSGEVHCLFGQWFKHYIVTKD